MQLSKPASTVMQILAFIVPPRAAKLWRFLRSLCSTLISGWLRQETTTSFDAAVITRAIRYQIENHAVIEFFHASGIFRRAPQIFLRAAGVELCNRHLENRTMRAIPSLLFVLVS